MIQSRFNIEFSPDTHVYKVNGFPKQSVTQRLKEAQVTGGYEFVKPYFRDRGTLVHDYCTLYAQGFLDMYYVRDDCVDAVRMFQLIMFEMGLKYIAEGKPSYDPEFDICGTPDLIMGWEGKRTLVELKSGVAPMWLGLQCHSYERMGSYDDILGIDLKNGKVYTKGDDWLKNVVACKQINSGFFDYAGWKSDRKRRGMKVIRR